MARLPQPGGDAGNWGDILNGYLNQSHNADGTLKDNSVGSTQLQDNSVTAITLAPNSVTSTALAADSVSKSQLQSVLRTEIDDKLTRAVADNTYASIDVVGSGISLQVDDAIGEYSWNFPAASYRADPSPRTLFGATSSTGEILYCHLDHSTGKVRRQVIGTSIVDDHHVPAISAPVGGAMLASWTDHNINNNVWFRVGDASGDPDTFGPLRSYNAGGLASYQALIRNPANLNEVWMLCRTWPTSSPYNWIIVKGTINPATNDIAWGTRRKLIEFATGDQGYIMISLATLSGNYGIRFAVTGNPINGTLHTVYYASIDLVTGAVSSPGKTLTHNVIDGTLLPLTPGDLDVAFTPPVGHTTRLFAVRGDNADPAVAIATWNPASSVSPTNYYHCARSAAAEPGMRLASTTSYVSTPVSSAMNVMTLSVRLKLKLDATNISQNLARRFVTAGDQRAWQLSLTAGGAIRFQWFPTGTSTALTQDSAPHGFVADTEYYLRVDFDPATRSTSVYTSTDDGMTWTQLGVTTTGVATVLFHGTAPLEIGSVTNAARGTVKKMVMQTIAGAIVASQDFTSPVLWANGDGAGATSTDSQGNVWTLAGSAGVSIDGWQNQALGEAGQAFSMQSGSRYVGGIAYPTPAKGDLLYVCRQLVGTSTLEKASKASGVWVYRKLDESESVLARPMSILDQGPLETLYSVITDYTSFQDFESNYRGI